MSHRKASLEVLEGRRLLSFTALDPTFGDYVDRGMVHLATSDNNTDLQDAGTPTVTAISDGRIVVIDASNIRYLRGDGALDVKRGVGGTRRIAVEDSSATILASAVDPAMGSIAIIREKSHIVDDVLIRSVTLEAYSVKGKLLRTRSLELGEGQRPMLAVGPNADLYIAIDATTTNGPTVSITKFAGAGGQISVANPTTGSLTLFGSEWRGAVKGIWVGPNGKLHVVSDVERYTNVDETESTEQILVHRLGDLSTLDPSFGSSGTAMIESGHSLLNQGSVAPHFADLTFAEDGSILALLTVHFGTGARQYKVQVVRLAGDSAQRSARVLTQGYGLPAIAGEIAVDRQANVLYVGMGNHFYKLHDNTAMGDVSGWSTFGSYLHSVGKYSVSQPGSMAVTTHGRLLVACLRIMWKGSWNSNVFSIKGPMESVAEAGVPQGTARLLKDGSLVIRGTGRNDRITIRHKGNSLIVELNSRTYKFFSSRDPNNSSWYPQIGGILVQGQNGNDRVEMAGSLSNFPLYIEGGAGNDTLLGSGGDDTLVGGDGDDSILGNGGNDNVYGQYGNDTLYGNSGGDTIYGSKGNDLIYASENGTDPNQDDFALDYLIPGAGRDTIRRDRIGTEVDRRDIIESTDGDRIV